MRNDTRTRTHTHTRTYTHTFAHAHTPSHLETSAHSHARARACTYKHTHNPSLVRTPTLTLTTTLTPTPNMTHVTMFLNTLVISQVRGASKELACIGLYSVAIILSNGSAICTSSQPGGRRTSHFRYRDKCSHCLVLFGCRHCHTI